MPLLLFCLWRLLAVTRPVNESIFQVVVLLDGIAFGAGGL